MKRQSKILFRIIFLLAVLFCSGTNAYSNFQTQPDGMEIPFGANNEDNIVFIDADFYDDEQINQFFEFLKSVDLEYQIPFLGNGILIPRYPASIWQPPKIQ